jgi:uncharacterized protein (DUF1810 family)
VFPSSHDPLGLDRFIREQAPVYDDVLAELRAGRKRTHWIWFVFPQLAGLGRSEMANRFAIGSLAEADAYLAHPVLGARLRECAALMLTHATGSARDILGSPDHMKLRSSMTLFGRLPDTALFQRVLDRFYDGLPDVATIELLRKLELR